MTPGDEPMPSVILVARLAGPLLAAIGIGVLLNQAVYTLAIAEAVQSTTLIFLTGVACLFAGLAILNAHRAWSADWRVIVTLLGWIFVFAGVMRIVLPQSAASAAIRIYLGSSVALPIVAAIAVLLGGYLSFEGYRRRA